MKHKLWKLVSALCVGVLALAFAAAPAWADPALANGTWGSCPWEISADGTLTVHPGTGAEPDSDAYSSPWIEQKELITSIVFVSENGNKAIAPADCSYLFAGLYKAKSIDCSGLDTSGVTNMSRMFSTRYSYDFFGWYSSSLTSVNLKGFDTRNVTDMSWMFANDEELTWLDLSSFKTGNVTDMSGMFWGCSKLAALDISGFTTQNILDASSIFYECNALSALKFGAGFVLSENAWTELKGLWLAASNGSVYSSAEILSRGVADTYTRSAIANGTWGTCAWEIDGTGTLTVHPGTGADQQESGWFGEYYCPWSEYSAYITKVVFAQEGGQKVIAPANVANLLSYLNKVVSIDLTGLDTSGVTDMQGFFMGCASLASLNLSGFDTRNVTNMSNMFAGCASLTTLDCSSFVTSKVTDMSGMFGTSSGSKTIMAATKSCSSLVSLDISSFDTTKVTDMSNMFKGLYGLQTLKVGAKFKEPTGTIGLGERAWSVPDGAWIAASDGKTYAGESLAFRGVADTYTRNNSVYTIGTWGTCAWEIGNDGTLTVHPGTGKNTNSANIFEPKSPWLEFSDHITSIVFVKENGRKAIAPAICSSLFANLEKVVSIDLSGLDTSGVTNMSDMFRADCQFSSSLESVNLKGVVTSNVTDMSGMFSGCTKLASLDVSGFDTSKVTDMSCMFGGFYAGGGEGGTDYWADGCESLTSLNVSNFDTGRVTDMANMFYGCSSLTSLDLSSFDTSNVTDMGAMFKNCSSLTSLDLSNFDTSRVTSFCAYQASGMSNYYEGMFEECKSLVSLNVSSFVTSGVDVLDCFFDGCASLRTLDLSSWDTSNVWTMVAMFRGCASLKTIYVSELWSLESIVESSSMFNYSGTAAMFGASSYWDTTIQDYVWVECVSLVGGNGTVYDSGHTGGEYARVDAAGQPGYFTYKAAPSAKTGWQNVNGGWYYYNADGTLLKDAFVPLGGKYYYVGKNGRLVTGGWIQYGGASYYIDADWSLALNRWVENGGAYYYFDENAQLVANGWKQIGGKSYYFDENAQLAVNRFVQYGSAWYYFDENAQLVVNGWKQVGGKSYYFDESAQLAVNTLIRHDGKYYYFGADAQLVTDKWVGAGNDWYYFKPDGSLALNEWVTYQGYNCHFNAKGICDNVRAA